MKQLDLILCAVALVIGIVGSWTVWAMREKPQAAPSVPIIDVAPVGLPGNTDPAMGTALPGAQGGAMGRGGRGKGKGGFVG